VRSQARHQLKQDRFAATATEAMSWTVEHRDKLIWGTAVAAIVLAVVLGGWWYMQSRTADADQALAQAMTVYSTPLTPGAQPAAGTTKTFATAQERAKAARDEFRNVADKYGRTNSGQLARYFVGLTDIDLNDKPTAEKDLKQAIDSGNADVASLAKMALASLYRGEGKDQQAIQLYKEIADHPTNSAPKTAAQLEMAETYEATDPQNARIVYQQIQKESPNTAAAQIAGDKLATMK
jgi:predicted negative regulator of RcsB-dependent stress response